MPDKALPSQDHLNKILRYEPETGRLFWRERTADYYGGDEFKARRFNGQHAGREAMTAVQAGYRIGGIDGAQYRAHRVIWKMCRGYDPDIVDHIDRERLNNRINNLRDVTASGNSKNRWLRCGVYITPSKKTFQLWVKRDGVRHYGGRFPTQIEAERERLPFLERLGLVHDERLARVMATWYPDTRPLD